MLRRIAKSAHGLFKNGLNGESGQRGFFRRFPDNAVAADQRERGIPCPDRNGEVERRNNERRSQRMPLLHHPVAGTFAGDGQPVQLTRKADGEVANVDHLLHFAQAFGQGLAAIDGDKARKAVLMVPQRIAEKAHQFATARCGNSAPFEENVVRRGDGGFNVGWRGNRHRADLAAVYWGVDGKVTTC